MVLPDKDTHLSQRESMLLKEMLSQTYLAQLTLEDLKHECFSSYPNLLHANNYWKTLDIDDLLLFTSLSLPLTLEQWTWCFGY